MIRMDPPVPKGLICAFSGHGVIKIFFFEEFEKMTFFQKIIFGENIFGEKSFKEKVRISLRILREIWEFLRNSQNNFSQKYFNKNFQNILKILRIPWEIFSSKVPTRNNFWLFSRETSGMDRYARIALHRPKNH